MSIRYRNHRLAPCRYRTASIWPGLAFPTRFSFPVAQLRLPVREALIAQRWPWLENQVMAEFKSVALGQTDGLRLVSRLAAGVAATFIPELSILTLYAIDVAAGDKLPGTGGPGISKSDLLVINKIDLVPMVGASLEVMDRDPRKISGQGPFVLFQPQERQGPGRDHGVHRA